MPRAAACVPNDQDTRPSMVMHRLFGSRGNFHLKHTHDCVFKQNLVTLRRCLHRIEAVGKTGLSCALSRKEPRMSPKIGMEDIPARNRSFRLEVNALSGFMAGSISFAWRTFRALARGGHCGLPNLDHDKFRRPDRSNADENIHNAIGDVGGRRGGCIAGNEVVVESSLPR